jgi:hypothetical protein
VGGDDHGVVDAFSAKKGSGFQGVFSGRQRTSFEQDLAGFHAKFHERLAHGDGLDASIPASTP